MPREWADTYVTVDANGNVTFDFNGHVHADGLDLDAGTISTPPADNKVRWIRTSDGAVVAELFGYDIVGENTLVLRGDNIGKPTNVAIQSGSLSSINIHSNSASNPDSYIDAVVGAFSKRILDGNGISDFLQTSDQGNFKSYAARLSCGIGPTIQAAMGVTGIVRTALGTYTITHDATSQIPYLMGTVSCQMNVANGATAGFESIDTTTSRIRITDPAGGFIDGEVVTLIGIG